MKLSFLFCLPAWLCFSFGSHFVVIVLCLSNSSLVEWGKERGKGGLYQEDHVCFLQEEGERRIRGKEKQSLCKWIIYTGFLELFAKVMMVDLSQSQNKLTLRTHAHTLKRSWWGYWRVWGSLYFHSRARNGGKVVRQLFFGSMHVFNKLMAGFITGVLVYRSCTIKTEVLKDCQHDLSYNEIGCNLFGNS